MALPFFADSTPRAYRLKAGNADLAISTCRGTFPLRNRVESRLATRQIKMRGFVSIATGHVTEGKRRHLLLQALRYAPSMRDIIAGRPEGSAYSDLLQRFVRKEGLEVRVKLDLRFLARSELADLVNHGCAVACFPFDDDTASYVAMEARG